MLGVGKSDTVGNGAVVCFRVNVMVISSEPLIDAVGGCERDDDEDPTSWESEVDDEGV